MLKVASCLLPLASCLPLLGGVRGGFLLPLASCLLPLAYTQPYITNPTKRLYLN
ncbi:MAG: hypothetical protein F6J90_40450 [Moorea sp. SIOASIH]|uniref:hypothetical protein n=1 Tax=Moorena sp. SIOASIH TaxID=2607817 RepID=UPI0013BB9BCD|nr:hypothetical protein [Moorena sp. SIOASIH]NEO42261.1 hypothetical protein [Moorena sp. SIOASIH]